MKLLWQVFRPPPPDADEKAALEARRRDLDRRSDVNRARLAEIQVNSIARRADV